MREYFSELRSFFRKGDMVLLMLCLVTSAYSTVIIASATNAEKFGGSTRYILLQIGASLIGAVLYAMVSSLDLETLSEHRVWLVAFNIFLLLLLVTPFGTDNNTGNRSWLDFPLIPFNIQPAEICKIAYVVIMASVMASHQNRLSSIPSVMHIVAHFGLIFGLNMVISSDLGVSLMFLFIFVGMAFAGGVNLIWFLLGGGLIVVGAPVLFPLLSERQQERFLYPYFPDQIDPSGLGAGYHTNQSLKSLTGGGMLGQGLFNGNRTQAGSLYAQHTDFIFSSIGEELGYLGCALVLILLFAIVARCVWVGMHSQDYMRRLVCFGAASSLLFQVILNVGMCIGVMPVIGLTLPFFSYGGSSVVSVYAMMGLVSGVHARPAAQSHERYIRPPLKI
ncbi:MAG: FtsW/RodA/SpoVE family cell cycle protein [Faecousia sp.]